MNAYCLRVVVAFVLFFFSFLYFIRFAFVLRLEAQEKRVFHSTRPFERFLRDLFGFIWFYTHMY